MHNALPLHSLPPLPCEGTLILCMPHQQGEVESLRERVQVRERWVPACLAASVQPPERGLACSRLAPLLATCAQRLCFSAGDAAAPAAAAALLALLCVFACPSALTCSGGHGKQVLKMGALCAHGSQHAHELAAAVRAGQLERLRCVQLEHALNKSEEFCKAVMESFSQAGSARVRSRGASCIFGAECCCCRRRRRHHRPDRCGRWWRLGAAGVAN